MKIVKHKPRVFVTIRYFKNVTPRVSSLFNKFCKCEEVAIENCEPKTTRYFTNVSSRTNSGLNQFYVYDNK